MIEEEEFKNWGDLNFDERAEVLEAFQNTEDRNESDKVAPREEDVKDYYEDNHAEKFNFAFCEHEWVKISKETRYRRYMVHKSKVMYPKEEQRKIED